MRHSMIAVLEKTGLIIAAFCLLSVHVSEMSKSSAADKALASTPATASLDLHAKAKDDNPDVLWHNTSTGANYILYLDGVTVLGGGSLPPVADQNWTIVP